MRWKPATLTACNTSGQVVRQGETHRLLHIYRVRSRWLLVTVSSLTSTALSRRISLFCSASSRTKSRDPLWKRGLVEAATCPHRALARGTAQCQTHNIVLTFVLKSVNCLKVFKCTARNQNEQACLRTTLAIPDWRFLHSRFSPQKSGFVT